MNQFAMHHVESITVNRRPEWLNLLIVQRGWEGERIETEITLFPRHGQPLPQIVDRA